MEEASLAEFTLAEMMEMNYLFDEVKEESLSQDFCQEIATSFSGSTARAGKSVILWEQVQDYFREKLNAAPAKVKSPSISFKTSATPDQTIPVSAPANSQKSKDGEINDLLELAFEAKSSKDGAWYDVASFLTYRFLSTGELEVRVRFSGFHKDHDEWVNVKRCVRERSVPLEATECHKVNVGDLVLCFQERSDHAVYCDAHILEIQRRLHDINGCRCIFLVRYVHDRSEEKVQLTRLCCRPT